MSENLLANHVKELKGSAILEMAQHTRALLNRGIDIINLGIGEPDFNTPEQVKEKAKQAIDANITHYPPVAGFDELRSAVAKKLKRDNGLSFHKDQIVISNGAKQALANVFLSLLNPGDEVLLPAPYWVSYPDMIRMAGGKPVVLQTNLRENFKLHPRQIEQAVTAKTKIFLLNAPSNPAGTVYSEEELASIAEVLVKHPGIFIVSDEIYEHINYSGKHHSIASFEFLQNRVAVINGVSKAFAMTGWRIGYMAGPQWLAAACSKIQGQITSGPSSISQMAAVEALRILPEKSPYLKNMVSAFKERRDMALQKLQLLEGVQVNLPQGAFYLFPDVSGYFGKTNGKKTISNSTELCLYLLEEARVALIPGEPFGMPECVRLSYALDKQQLSEALFRMEKALLRLR